MTVILHSRVYFLPLAVFHVVTASLHAISSHVHTIVDRNTLQRLAIRTRVICCYAEAWMGCVRLWWGAMLRVNKHCNTLQAYTNHIQWRHQILLWGVKNKYRVLKIERPSFHRTLCLGITTGSILPKSHSVLLPSYANFSIIETWKKDYE